MYKILKNEPISADSYLMEIKYPLPDNKVLPGKFVIVMAKKDSERIPLTIYKYDKEKEILSIIYQVIGASTEELSTLKDEIFVVAGPLGNANEICENPKEYKDKKIVYIAGGVGIAPVYPQVKYLKEHGINVDVIYGSRREDLLLLRDEIEQVSNNVRYATDDGSYGRQGFVTDILKENINDYDIVVAIGPMIMMKNVANLTKEYNIKTIVSMNPIMVDGSGMCGACRVEVGGKSKFACVDGPEFDGHLVNFDLAMKRMGIYREEEQTKWKLMKKELKEEVK